MTGARASDAQRRRFLELVAAGMSVARASAEVGMSRSWGWRISRGLTSSQNLVTIEREEQLQPDPKAWDQLDGGVRDTLKDFNLFCEVFLLRQSMAWRYDAAMRTVEALQDESRRTYIVANEPPGSGKSTLFTCDIPLWLIAGGGFEDVLRGRALRAMLGAYGMTTSRHYVRRLRTLLESPRAFYDKNTQRSGELSLVQAFGRFKPRQPGVPWREDELIVEQMADIDLTEKEPSLQAASRERGFLGERVELAVWDDLVVTGNVRTTEVRANLASWFADEAESRIEPGGVLLLVGQRLGPDDLYRNRLDVVYIDEDGQSRRKYEHIVYPAHRDDGCDGDHRQWDGAHDGCLLDGSRLPMGELEIEKQSNPRKYRLLFQQEDVDPAGALVAPEWLDGGTDKDGVVRVGCYDRDRGFLEWPKGISGLIDVVTVDPSAGNFWGIEWWAVHPETRAQYLIRGIRSRSFRAGDLLESGEGGRLTGVMQDWQELSVQRGHPIKCWVIEGNSAFRHLVQYDHYRRWQQQWPGVNVILHKTSDVNKFDAVLGVEAILPQLYSQGLARLPRKPGDLEALTFMNAFIKELTQYPEGATTDLVMAHWQLCWNLEHIVRMATRGPAFVAGLEHLPEYLLRQQREIPIAR